MKKPSTFILHPCIILHMSNSNHFHAVLFDLDGTLRHDQPKSFEILVDYLQKLGHIFQLTQLKQAECWSHYYWTRSAEHKIDLETFGEVNEAFWVRQIERQLLAL